jgi:hypothetical protein
MRGVFRIRREGRMVRSGKKRVVRRVIGKGVKGR